MHLKQNLKKEKKKEKTIEDVWKNGLLENHHSVESVVKCSIRPSLTFKKSRSRVILKKTYFKK